MRPGIAQDGVTLALPAGNYRCEYLPATDSGLATISYLHEGKTVVAESKAGEVNLDMARVGVVELKPLLAQHGGDWDALADWSDETAAGREKNWGGTLPAKGIHAAFFATGGDGTLEVFKLRDRHGIIGLRLKPKPRPKLKQKRRRWTHVYVKIAGLGDPWHFCHDWDYEADDESALDEIAYELSYFTEEDIDHGVPLARYCAKFKGIKAITVDYEGKIGDGAPSVRSITRQLKIPALKKSVTANQLAAAVVKIQRDSEKLE
jgi:hypothetical protein